MWRYSPPFWGASAFSLLLFLLIFSGVAESLFRTWGAQEEYSHGYFIPVISAYLIYQRRSILESILFDGSWVGVVLLLVGGVLIIFGRLAVISTMGQYALVISIWGLALALMGWRAFKVIWPALFMLVFMVKLPTFLYNNISSELQLISSQIGVWFIRLFDISVYHEGNVIDLGAMKLQVVEACSGLRYLFPLMALSMILAIMYRGSIWLKALIFLSSMPVSILMNSLRIGAIGVTVEYWGQEMAEGILHDFEGWVVFMSALAVIFLEIKLIGIIMGDKRPFSEILSLDPPAVEVTEPQSTKIAAVPKTFYVVIPLLIGVAIANSYLVVAETVYPERQKLSGFPAMVDEWQGRTSTMETQFLVELALDDYILADYQAVYSQPVNFYVAYYDVQAEGEGTIHSPRSCLPGSGWKIKSLTQEPVPGVVMDGVPLLVNRALIAKGDNQALIYYWLQGRGRIISNEFMAKWWIFWDRLTKGRSDGALVRVMVEVGEFGSLEQSEHDMQKFIQSISGELPKYIPD